MQPSAAVPSSVVRGSSRPHPVSDAADGAYETGLVDLVAVPLPTPHPLDQLPPGERRLRSRGHNRQQVELGPSELDSGVVDSDDTTTDPRESSTPTSSGSLTHLFTHRPGESAPAAADGVTGNDDRRGNDCPDGLGVARGCEGKPVSKCM